MHGLHRRITRTTLPSIFQALLIQARVHGRDKETLPARKLFRNKQSCSAPSQGDLIKTVATSASNVQQIHRLFRDMRRLIQLAVRVRSPCSTVVVTKMGNVATNHFTTTIGGHSDSDTGIRAAHRVVDIRVTRRRVSHSSPLSGQLVQSSACIATCFN
jgi:hypothetical protein